MDLLVVGLGNPGREYERTRHNVGWLVADELARRHNGSWRGKFSGQLAEVRLDGLKLALLKPETFMNDSGRSVADYVLSGFTGEQDVDGLVARGADAVETIARSGLDEAQQRFN